MLRLSRASARRTIAVLGVAGLACAGAGLQAVPAAADTAPVPATSTPTVSADALPTVQVNGVVWSTVIAGNRVYAAGQFTSARPAGSPAGTNETPRSNILAFDLTTGALITSWAPTLNGTGQTLAASPDGGRIYVAGNFTQVSGVNRYRMVALDATTGAVVPSFAPAFNARTRSVAVGGDGTVYVGGIFTVVNNQPRERLAAINPATGALLPWAPAADKEVLALTAPAGSGKVFAGGKFFSVNGDTSAYGLAMIDATSGALLPFPANQVVRNAGDSAAVYGLTTDGTRVYGVGYTFGGGGNFEGTFAAEVATGALTWVTGCRGDQYAVSVGHGVVYNVGHVHDCGMIGGNPQTEPWTFQYSYAQHAGPAPDGRVNQGGTFGGRPAPELLHWLPTLTTGTFTGQDQAGWATSANDDYVVLGGEFPRVNGTNQQGLVRFAKRALAPNKQGPQGGNDLNPTLISLAPGTIRVSWRSAWDRDNQRLTYTVLKGATLAGSVPIGTVTGDSAWWSRPNLSLTDTAATPGTTQSYRIRVTDPLGNVVTGNPTSVTVPAGTAGPTPYGDAVRADGPTSYWPLGEASGTTGFDWAGADDLTVDASATRGAAGGITTEPAATATTFPGSAGVPAASGTQRTAPNTFSAEAWFRTTTTSGGKVLGYGNSRTGTSSNYDRHVYLTNDGRLVYGVYDNSVRTVATTETYNDGDWHHVVVTLGSGGMALYVDGELAGSRTDTTVGQPYGGWWRIGGDNLNGWSNQPASASFAGTIDDVAIYPTALSAAAVRRHWQAGTGTGTPVNQEPTAAFTTTATDLAVAFDGRGSADADGTVASYAWEYGDGATGTGATSSHTYAAAGTYTARLTVTDDDGATGTVTRQVTVTAPPVPNQAPTAAFTSTATDLAVAFDGRGSADADGTVASYAWDYGDGTTGTGATSSRTYAAAGTYTVTLTVTDDDGATDAETKTVTVTAAPVPNQAPTAAFTSTAADLAVAFDGRGSADADGTVASYAWEYGDGATGTGATSSHTYAAAGTYTARLTVTDDDGATGTVTRQVTVTATPAADPAVARDAFGRAVATGLGSADLGGPWTVSASGVTVSVADGSGRLSVPAGRTATARLGSVSARDVDLLSTTWLEGAPTGGGVYLSAAVRTSAAGEYRSRVRLQADGKVLVNLSKVAGTTETALTSQLTLPGLTYTAGTKLLVRTQATGTGTTTLRVKVWVAGTAEPTAWTQSVTDTTAGLQGAGGVGLVDYASGSATAASVVRHDDLVATAL